MTTLLTTNSIKVLFVLFLSVSNLASMTIYEVVNKPNVKIYYCEDNTFKGVIDKEIVFVAEEEKDEKIKFKFFNKKDGKTEIIYERDTNNENLSDDDKEYINKILDELEKQRKLDKYKFEKEQEFKKYKFEKEKELEKKKNNIKEKKEKSSWEKFVNYISKGV